MNKDFHIKYWMETSENDWKSAKILFEGKQFVFCLFTRHLVIEKLLKAHWVKDNDENIPPRTHNLLYICGQTTLNLIQEDLEFLREMTNWNIEGRYPDYQRKFYKVCTFDYTKTNLEEVNRLRECLLQKML